MNNQVADRHEELMNPGVFHGVAPEYLAGTFDLRCSIDRLLLWKDRASEVGPEADAYRAAVDLQIHEYAAASFAGTSARGTAIHASQSLEAKQNIEWWIAQGRNPFNELGLVNPNALRRRTRSEQAEHDTTVAPVMETEQRQAFLARIGFADAFKQNAPKHHEHKNPPRHLRNRMNERADFAIEAVKNSGARLRTLGRTAVDRVVSILPSSAERSPSLWTRKRMALAGIAALAVGAVFVGVASGAQNRSGDTVASKSSTSIDRAAVVYEAPSTTTTLDLELPQEEREIPPVISQTDVAPEAPSDLEEAEAMDDIPSTFVIGNGPEGYLWNLIQAEIQEGEYGAEADSVVEAQAVIAQAMPLIAAGNGLSPEELNNLPVGAEVQVGPQAKEILKSFESTR